MKLIITISFIIYPFIITAQDPVQLSFRVTDEEGNGLPFATVRISNSGLGTISSESGYVTLMLQEENKNDTIIISYIGYELKKLLPNEIEPESSISLKSEAALLSEVIIRPLSPDGYLKRAVKAIPDNYVPHAFGTQSYYRELFSENDHFIKMEECVFQSQYEKKQDTIKGEHKLVLYRQGDIQKMEFMAEKSEKKKRKKEKKALKKNDTTALEDINSDAVVVSFGGPESVISRDIINSIPDFLDSAKFKKFDYWFSDPIMYEGKQMITIAFESKRTYDYMKWEGEIHLEPVTYAISHISMEGDFIIPLFIRPILLAAGLGVKEPQFQATAQYQFINGYWYPDLLMEKINGTLTKRYIFRKNETSAFVIQQLMKVNKIIHPPDSYPIEKEDQYDPAKAFEKQVIPTNLDWNAVDVVGL